MLHATTPCWVSPCGKPKTPLTSLGWSDGELKMIRVTALIVALLIPVSGHADVRSNASVALENWEPLDLSFESGTLTVLLPQRRVTQDIFMAIVRFGICLGVAAGDDLSEVSELVILNQFGQQGYVYERGAQDCDILNQMRSGADVRVLGSTRVY
jgi:hypothetical protein